MRWEGLFADLEAQAEALDRTERAVEIDERSRAETGRLPAHERFRAAVGLSLRLRLAGGWSVPARLVEVGADWLLLADDTSELLVPETAVLGVRGLTRFAATPGTGGVVGSRLVLRTALRGIVRDRAAVRLQLTDGATVDGTLDRVGADWVEIAAHATGETRRRDSVRETELVPFTAIAVVRRRE